MQVLASTRLRAHGTRFAHALALAERACTYVHVDGSGSMSEATWSSLRHRTHGWLHWRYSLSPSPSIANNGLSISDFFAYHPHWSKKSPKPRKIHQNGAKSPKPPASLFFGGFFTRSGSVPYPPTTGLTQVPPPLRYPRATNSVKPWSY